VLIRILFLRVREKAEAEDPVEASTEDTETSGFGWNRWLSLSIEDSSCSSVEEGTAESAGGRRFASSPIPSSNKFSREYETTKGGFCISRQSASLFITQKRETTFVFYANPYNNASTVIKEKKNHRSS
jgi:hypothetical protein